MLPALTHIALQVKDLDASIAFYSAFCAMEVVHDRGSGDRRVVWLGQPGKEHEFIFVLMRGDHRPPQHPRDYSHLGYALESKAAVDAIAQRAADAGAPAGGSAKVRGGGRPGGKGLEGE